ncbi:MAG: ABC transporter permease subunit [Clostridium argentinense]|uniref:ABC transporter permease subunit n=1 Tax=Clostridium faecium TaxID=2762223 RepID=A0ABR8YPB0_9CLOT|nr:MULTISPECIES: ABC transporter permease subunit [Clostridium]MBD8046096.1 ABC transporter permease subunit [Clostridium faecium]MBS5824753.1 ABC transporter permease subunit [Clostridium argentinense]MDU1349581.1 ABC transporter permease subunit [Clostridium argentinense]
MSKISRALIYKDIKDITSSKQILIPMIIVPLIFVIIFPTAVLLLLNFLPDVTKTMNGFDALIDKLPYTYKTLTNEQMVLTVLTNYLFPSFFLLIPIMCSTLIGASSFVGEKEHKTMETLLYTPISIEELFRAKLLGVFIPTYIITLICSIIFGIIINIGGLTYFHKLIFPNIKWIILILYLTPSIALLGLTFTILISAKSKTFQEAQQIAGLIVLPIILLAVGQITGIFLLTNIMLIIIGTIIIIIDYILLKKIAKNFTAENLI